MVEDHPLDYRDFEGVIPEGSYGAGSVIIWDRGLYRHPSDNEGKESERLLLEGLRKGDMKFVLEGEKLQGEFALVKTRQDEKSWLLLKKKDIYATREDILTENRSVVSAQTLEDVAEADPKNHSARKKLEQIRLREAMEGEDLRDAPVTPMPHNIAPMLATLTKEPFEPSGLALRGEMGRYRAVAEIRDGKVSLYSRNRISFNRKFAPIAEVLEKFRFDAVLDGEIVVVDDRGQSDFQMLQDYRKSGRGHLIYYVFDLLHFAGHDLTTLPLVRRKKLLRKILPAAPNIKFSDHIKEEASCFPGRQRKRTRGDHCQTIAEYVPDRQEEPAMAEGEDVPHAGGGDRGIHGTQGEEKESGRPGPGRVQRGRADFHRSHRERFQCRDSQRSPRKIGSPDPEEVPLYGRAKNEYPGYLGKTGTGLRGRFPWLDR